MKIAVQGCAHGELETIYNTIEYIEKEYDITVDLLICCGDFQATRNLEDLKCMAVPPKFRNLCTFYKYYSGEKLAPKLTIFIGGNHEASNYLQELPYGGWVAPNIYYLGYAGVVNVAGIRIAGLSGIFKGRDFARGRYEKPPYNDDTLRSCYHIRNLDVFRLKQLSSPVHIMLSHDWPAGIANYGNIQKLLKSKPFFKEEIENNTLGSKPTAELLEYIKPNYWFAAHLHVKFAALVDHKDEYKRTTKFLALDKCLPNRKFLQIVDIEHDKEEEIQLKYDLEWLTILYLTNHLLSIKKLNTYMPGPGCNERWIFTPSEEDKDLVRKKFKNDLNIPNNFSPTAPAHDTSSKNQSNVCHQIKLNPQTKEFCDKLSVDDPISLLLEEDSLNIKVNLNSSTLENSSFIASTDSDVASPVTNMDFSRIRTPLKLPSPGFKSNDQSDNDIYLSTPLGKDQMQFLNHNDTSTENEVEESFTMERNLEESSTPWPKKFRRRNVDLYSSTDGD